LGLVNRLVNNWIGLWLL